MKERMNEKMKKMNEWMNESNLVTNEWMNEQMKVIQWWMDGWINEWKKENENEIKGIYWKIELMNEWMK